MRGQQGSMLLRCLRRCSGAGCTRLGCRGAVCLRWRPVPICSLPGYTMHPCAHLTTIPKHGQERSMHGYERLGSHGKYGIFVKHL